MRFRLQVIHDPFNAGIGTCQEWVVQFQGEVKSGPPRGPRILRISPLSTSQAAWGELSARLPLVSLPVVLPGGFQRCSFSGGYGTPI
jgi:hypothetical protein